jgi:hypothetical protein
MIRSMRIAVTLFALLMLAFVESANAQYWVGLALSVDGTELLADTDSIKPIMGDRVAIWAYRRGGPPLFLKDGRVRYSYKTRYFADCSKNQIGTNEAIWYDSEEKVLNRYLYPIPEMDLTTPNTNGESVFLFACDAAHRKKQTEWYESFNAPKVKAP